MASSNNDSDPRDELDLYLADIYVNREEDQEKTALE